MKSVPLFVKALLVACVFILAACGSQAKKGSLYIAGDKAEIVTVVASRDIKFCSVSEGTIAFGERETYFDIFQGSAGYEEVKLTEVVHNGNACSSGASYDFIRQDPEKAGWTELKAGSAEWLQALKTLCQTDRTKPDELQELCEAH